MQNFKFGRELRLLTPGEFNAVFQQPFRAGSPLFTILCSNNNLDHPRLGLIIAKKRAKLAVDRNRIKRCIRENFRLQQHRLPAIDLVVMVKGPISDTENQELSKQLERLWNKICRHYSV
ncbi:MULTISPECIES: ribonuclease P protein component [Alkalimonas]|uniref:Ribonuclease P protein component n=2 Tax=Alkalimonas TaxID=265980 RepID=A0A1H4D2H2_ALKAM|nr:MULTISPECIES: ribonuclease P protein component [Alkalimonas]MCC5825962.1 ribonuclease P protein component [Alkalimonas sp.]MEE2002697.1 ribonuclease P protein component [Alkalimonas sp. MEB108]SEA66904.1 ribonuclease P protein component [Alkalimonas amylolytica]